MSSTNHNPLIDSVPAGTAANLAAVLEFVAGDKDIHPGLFLILTAARDAAAHLRDALELEADDARVDAEADSKTTGKF